jgi:acyl-coenzyme A synthetase/AMP-(fatty) acid ligase
MVDLLNKITVVDSKNSLNYVDVAFKIFNSGSVLVNTNHNINIDDYTGIQHQERVEINDSFGWYTGENYKPIDNSEIAQLVFTSGTEGTSKCIAISNRALKNTAERLIDVMEIDSSIKEYVGIPVNYSFGFGRCRAISLAGGDFYLSKDGFNILEISEMLSDNLINSISAVPSLFRILIENEHFFEISGKKLQWIEIGSQYMSAEEKRHLKAIFPNAKIIQHYGLTEASRSTFLKIHDEPDSVLESVGVGLFGVDVKIHDDGRIKIRGPHVSSGMIVDGEIISLLDDDWLITNDTGSIRDGYLYFHGRLDDIINCGGIKISPEKIESSINFTDVNYCITKIPHDLLGEQVAIVTEGCGESIKTELSKAVVSELETIGIKSAKNIPIFTLDELPKTATGKLQRNKISKLIKQPQHSSISNKSSTLPSNTTHFEESITAIWQEVLNIDEVSVHDSFFDLGGDSLSAIRVSLKMESIGLSRELCRKVFEGKSIYEIVTQQRDESQTRDSIQYTDNQSKTITTRTELANASLTLNFIRGVFVLLNIFAHWSGGLFARLPEFLLPINKYLSPLFSSGTPGFAIIFGAGIGFFIYSRFKIEPDSVRKLAIRNALIIATGLILLASTKSVYHYITYSNLPPLVVSNSFYSVLYYYFFAVLSIPIWMKLLTFRGSFELNALLAAVLLYLCHIFIEQASISPSESVFIQPWILLITAKYNYFEMTSGVMLGIVIGCWFKQSINNGEKRDHLIYIGVLLIISSFIISLEMQHIHLWLIWPKGLFLWSWLFYVGITLFLIKIVYTFTTSELYSHNRYLNICFNIVSIIGILAFPLFIGHELVIPLANILRDIGISLGLLISLMLFFLFAGYLLRKIYRHYY